MTVCLMLSLVTATGAKRIRLVPDGYGSGGLDGISLCLCRSRLGGPKKL